LGFTWAGSARAHALLETPAPRDQQDGYKDGTACGVARASSQPSTTYRGGQELEVKWLETVNHNGCFLVELSMAGDRDFQVLGRTSHGNPPAPADPTSVDPRRWSQLVTLPNISCDDCTLRLRQLMLDQDLTGDACPPATIPAGATYTTCANITLTAAAAAPSDESGCSLTGRHSAGWLSGSLLAVVALLAGRRRAVHRSR
jgi:hypothetical protein